MLALLDGDIYLYRVAAGCENETLEIAKERLVHSFETTLGNLNATSFKIFLSGSNNFRHKIYPEYKANRRNTVDPIHREALKEFALMEWNATMCDGYEADDGMGIAQDKEFDDVSRWSKIRADDIVVREWSGTSTICTIDKDLNMIPGWHYNFVKEQKFFVNELDALRFFYEQLLIGDKADNIIGVDRIGPVKAQRALAYAETEEEMFNTVRDMYNDDARLLINCRCLWIWRKEDDDWVNSVHGKELVDALGLKIE